MRNLILILTACVAFGCAHTTIDTKTAKGATNHARFEGDMQNTTFTVSADGAISWHADTVNHSVATLAQGTATTNKITAAGGIILGAVAGKGL